MDTSSSSADAQPSPTSLPGRDPMADADSSMIRKRPRLTPPQHNSDNGDSPGHCMRSPLVIEVNTPVDQIDPPDPPTAVIIMDDETLDQDSLIALFPWSNTDRNPEETAAAFANLCCELNSKDLVFHNVEDFAAWVQNHVAHTSTVHDHQTYIEDRSFWHHVGRCFEGLANRKLDLKGYEKESFYREFLGAFAILYARLCAAEAEQLEQATSRRDSAKPNNLVPAKHQLVFQPYTNSFEKFMTRGQSAEETADDEDGLSTIKRRMASVFIQEQKRTNSFLRIFTLVATRADMVESAHEALLTQLRLSERILSATSTSKESESTTAEMAQDVVCAMFELSITQFLPATTKLHPDYLPASLHSSIADTLVTVLERLPDDYCPPALAKALETVAQYQITSEDLVNPRYEHSPTMLEKSTKQSRSVALRLEILGSFIRSGIMALRVTGLELLSAFLLKLYTEHFQNSGLLHPLLHFVARYLLSNGYIPYLFGSESHADLIRRSSKVVEFLFVTNHLAKNDADILWSTCLFKQHTDVGQASFHVLSSLNRNDRYAEMMYFARKFDDISPSQSDKPIISLFDRILPKKAPSPPAYFDLACISVRILQRVSAEWGDLDFHHLCEAFTGQIKEFLGKLDRMSPYRRTLLEICAKDIKDRTRYATGSAHVLLDLSISARILGLQIDLTDVLSFDQVTGELCQYVDHLKSKHAPASFPNWALFIRIRLAHLMLACAPEACGADPEKMFWDHTFGVEAMDNDARNIAWHAMSHDLLIAPSLAPYLDRCARLYLRTIPSSCATPTMLPTYRYALEKTLMGLEADFPLGDEIVRFTLTAPTEAVAEDFMAAVIEALFNNQAMKYPEAAIEQQVAVADKCIDCIRTRTDNQHLRAVKLLRKLLLQSHEFDRTIRTPETDIVSDTEPRTSAQGELRLPVQIWGPLGQGARQIVVVKESETLSNLQAALAAIARSNDFRVICGGRLLDLKGHPKEQISDSGITGKALIVKKNDTLQSIKDDRSKRVGRTAVERAILRHFDGLYAQLDNTDNDGRELFWLLTDLQPNTTWQPVSLEANPLKVLFSVHCLSFELNEYLALGVADAPFMLQGIHALVRALKQFGSTTDWLLLRITTETLFKFLRERPTHDLSIQYFEDPSQFVASTLSTLDRIACVAENPGSMEDHEIYYLPQTTMNLYRSLLEGVRLSPAVCREFVEARDIGSYHKRLLFNRNQALSGSISKCIKNFCRDDATPTEVKTLYWNIFLSCVPGAQVDPNLCASLYNMVPEILGAGASVISSEGELKSLIANFSATLLRTEHWERFGADLVDHRVSGLCSLLLCCVSRLKSYKKPLKFGNIALRIFQRFLFPQTSDSTDRDAQFAPIITSTTRQGLYSLVYALCEDLPTLEALADVTLDALKASEIPLFFQYQGRENFNRSECGYAGLVNLQQTCYMNSLLQQLYMNIRFRKFILDTPVVSQSRQTVLQEFKWAFASMQDSYSMAYSPETLAKALDVDVTVQDDAQIFFTILMGKLEDSMPDEEAKKNLKNFFAGSNKSQTIGQCGHVSESPDTYYNLSLVVKDKSCLEESLREYVQGAPLEGGDKFKCMACNADDGGSYVNATRRTGLEHVPDSLVLGLKRFRYETYDGGAKVNDRFDFPEHIDMTPYKIECLTGSPEPLDPDVFRLVGVVVHDGTLQYGHYWSYAAERSVLESDSMPWYKLEDRFANRVTVHDVISETRGGFGTPDRTGQSWLRSDNAYVLFYERLSSVESAKTLVVEDPPIVGRAMGLCPKVSVPEDFEHVIALENEKHVRKQSIYAIEHADFVRSLLLKFEDISKGQPTDDNSTEAWLLSLAFEHFFQVTTRTQSLDHMDRIVASLRQLTSSNPNNASQFLEMMLRPDTLERFVFHRRPAVRTHMRHLLVSCLRFLREQDPSTYGIDAEGRIVDNDRTYISRVVRTHSDLLTRLYMAQARAAWPEYFAFVTDVAAFGQHETTLLLDRGYLKWCLDILVINHNQSLQVKHADIWYYMQNNRVYPLHILSDCIYGLISEHVDLRNFDLLDEEEKNLINWRVKRGRNLLVTLAISTVKEKECCSGPAKLTMLFMDKVKAEKGLAESVFTALMYGLLNSDDYPSYTEVIACCINKGNLAQTHKARLMETVAQLPHHCVDVSETVLKFMRDVYPTEPSAVLSIVVVWASKLLVSADSISETATMKWLQDHLFHDPPLASTESREKLVLEMGRTTAIRSLAATLMETLKSGREMGHEYSEYEAAVDSLKACDTWLQRFVDAMKTYSWSEGTDRSITSGDQELSIIMETLEEAAEDASALVEQYEEEVKSLTEWLEGSNNDLALRYKRSARSLVADEEDDDYNDDNLEEYNTDGEVESGDDWASEIGEPDIP